MHRLTLWLFGGGLLGLAAADSAFAYLGVRIAGGDEAGRIGADTLLRDAAVALPSSALGYQRVPGRPRPRLVT